MTIQNSSSHERTKARTNWQTDENTQILTLPKDGRSNNEDVFNKL